MRKLVVLSGLLPTVALANAAGSDLGKAEGQCRVNEQGPAIIVTVDGLKDRKGLLKLEVYPPNDEDFLGDDSTLLAKGKVFRRVEEPVTQAGPVRLCVRVPGPGAYTMSLLHDRLGNHKFSLSNDGIGFASNPRLGLSKPRAASARILAGSGLTNTTIIMNYRKGLFEFGPLKGR